MNNIEIKQASLEDIEKLQHVSQQTFRETFAAVNTEEDMRKYEEENFSHRKLSMQLNNPASVFYFVLLNDNIAGYLKLNFGQAQTELKNNNALEIERIYVLKEYQGLKLGQLLYQEAVKIAKQRRANFIWLGVWEKNSNAIGFYKKNGFAEFDKHTFWLGDDEQTDLMMKLEIL